MRTTKAPPARRAETQAASATQTPPKWRSPVGDGANRVRTINVVPPRAGHRVEWVPRPKTEGLHGELQPLCRASGGPAISESASGRRGAASALGDRRGPGRSLGSLQ